MENYDEEKEFFYNTYAKRARSLIQHINDKAELGLSDSSMNAEFESSMKKLETIRDYKDSEALLKELRTGKASAEEKIRAHQEEVQRVIRRNRKIGIGICAGIGGIAAFLAVFFPTYNNVPKGCKFDNKTGMLYIGQNCSKTVKVPSVIHYRKVKEVTTDGLGYNTHQYALGFRENLEKVILPEGMSKVSCGAFQDCASLKEVVLPSSLKTIEAGAFVHCSALESITIPESVTSIGSSAFYGCSSLTSLELPSGLTELGTEAFSGCSLTDICIPSSLTSISSGCFSYCDFTDLTIPGNIKTIDYRAFYMCTSLESVYMEEGIERIGEEAFDNAELCSKSVVITNLHLPSTLKSMGYLAFSRETVTLDDDWYVGTEENPYLWLEHACNETINAGCKYISDFAFTWDYNYRSYDSVVIPEGALGIGADVFYRAHVKSLTIPKSVTFIDETAFDYTYDRGDPEKWRGGVDEVIYQGTMKEWKMLVSDFSSDGRFYFTVECTDGTIPQASSEEDSL